MTAQIQWWTPFAQGASRRSEELALDELARRYVICATAKLSVFEYDDRVWRDTPRDSRGPKPGRPSPRALAAELSPDCSQYAAERRLDAARQPDRLRRLGLDDPLTEGDLWDER